MLVLRTSRITGTPSWMVSAVATTLRASPSYLPSCKLRPEIIWSEVSGAYTAAGCYSRGGCWSGPEAVLP